MLGVSQKYTFGDGLYRGGVWGGGVSVLGNDVRITGEAFITPDASTLSSVLTCNSLVLDGTLANLSPSTNSKGFVVLAKGGVYLKNGSKLHINYKGYAGNFGAITALDLLPRALLPRVKPRVLRGYVIPAEHPGPGFAAGPMQVGAGSTMNGPYYWGSGAKGGPCCGGAGGSRGTTGDYGGPGGTCVEGDPSHPSGGGGGHPVGTSNDGGAPGMGAGGGLLMLFTPYLYIELGCVISANGANGGYGGFMGGGGTGGGCIVIVTKEGGYVNRGTVQAIAGRSGQGGNQPGSVVYGTAGSVNTFVV